MRRLILTMLTLSLTGAGGCVVLPPQPEASWTDTRIAEDRDRAAPHYVPDIPRPVAQSWMMASQARTLADTRDLTITAQALLELPTPGSLEYGQQARARAVPPPPPARD